MLDTARRLPAEDPITYPRDERPLDAYSRAVTTVVDRVGPRSSGSKVSPMIAAAASAPA
jgi:hypothetical protein